MLFGDVAFSKYFLYHFRFLFVWTIEYVVLRFLSFRMVLFLPCDHGLDFLHQSAYYVRIQSIMYYNNIIAHTVLFNNCGYDPRAIQR